MATKTVKYQGAMNAKQAEAAAGREGVRFAGELGIRTLILKGDASTMFKSFSNSKENLSYSGLILSKAYDLASTFFFKAQYVPRNCNSVAHKLARLAKNEGSKEWINEAPPCIASVLILDAFSCMNSLFTMKKKKPSFNNYIIDYFEYDQIIYNLNYFKKRYYKFKYA